jgi:type IV pilus assembly protein PilM
MNFFSKLFQKSHDAVVGIDIGSSAIKVVQLSKRKGKAVLDTYGALSLGPYANKEVGRATNLPIGKIVEALSDILRESKTTTKFGGIAIPFSSSLMNVIELPSAAEKNLDNIIPLEAKKYVPVPVNEVSLDWSIVSKKESKQEAESPAEENQPQSNNSKKSKEENAKGIIEVLLVAIHNDVSNKFKEVAQASAFQSYFFEIETFSTMRAVLDNKNQPILVMDFGAASTKLYIVENGNIKSTHTINRGSQDITDNISGVLGVSTKEAEILKRTVGLDARGNRRLYDAAFITLDYVFAESNRVIREYREKNQKNIDEVILVGGGSSMRGFTESSSANLQANVLVGDPFSKVEAPAFVSGVLKNSGPEFTVALGMALRGISKEG